MPAHDFVNISISCCCKYVLCRWTCLQIHYRQSVFDSQMKIILFLQEVCSIRPREGCPDWICCHCCPASLRNSQLSVVCYLFMGTFTLTSFVLLITFGVCLVGPYVYVLQFVPTTCKSVEYSYSGVYVTREICKYVEIPVFLKFVFTFWASFKWNDWRFLCDSRSVVDTLHVYFSCCNN